MNDIVKWQLNQPRLWDWLEDQWLTAAPFGLTRSNGIRVEEFISGDEFILRAEVPGVDPAKDLSVAVDHGQITISGERREERKRDHRSEFFYGKFSRVISLPRDAHMDKIDANYANGILEVRVKLEHQAIGALKVPIKVEQLAVEAGAGKT